MIYRDYPYDLLMDILKVNRMGNYRRRSLNGREKEDDMIKIKYGIKADSPV
jgi:hypothetical protein